MPDQCFQRGASVQVGRHTAITLPLKRKPVYGLEYHLAGFWNEAATLQRPTDIRHQMGLASPLLHVTQGLSGLHAVELTNDADNSRSPFSCRTL
jgi:hypothetical protein